MTIGISFMSANYVAREVGFAMHGWGHGDRATNDAFRPLATFAERFDELLAGIRALGFDALDLWGAHLNPDWATAEHLAIAHDALERHGLRVASLAVFVGKKREELEAACDVADAVGTKLLGGLTSGTAETLVPILRERGVRLGIENHPEKTPAELLAKIGDGDGTIGATVDTGWWATHGYDAPRAIEELGEHVFHVHLKDVLAHGAHDTCRWGRGVVDIEGCVRALERIGYAGTISVEHEPEQYDPTDDIREMLPMLQAWLA
jgi:sugar phosphate isomerase/epimerase